MHLWIIRNDFDSEINEYSGDATDVINFISTWDDYTFDQINTTKDNIYISGTVVVGDGEVPVRFWANRINITTSHALYVKKFLDNMDVESRETLSALLMERNSNAGHMLFRKMIKEGQKE